MKTDKLKLTTALDWVNRRLKEQPHLAKHKVVEEAAIRFNLGPLDEEWLSNQINRQAPPS